MYVFTHIKMTVMKLTSLSRDKNNNVKMPLKKVKVKKRMDSEGSVEDRENMPPAGDIRYDQDSIKSILKDLESRLEAKCLQIQKETEFMATSIQQSFHLELIKIPTQVKQMSLAKFRDEYGESMEAVTRGTIAGKPPMPAPRTASKSTRSRDSDAKVFQTPVGRRGPLALAGTSLRNPREGETILSQNGSPLGVFQTVVKAAKPAPVAQTPAGIFVPLKNGEVVDLESISNLPQEERQDALKKMQDMMNSMQSLMKKIEK